MFVIRMASEKRYSMGQNLKLADAFCWSVEHALKWPRMKRMAEGVPVSLLQLLVAPHHSRRR